MNYLEKTCPQHPFALLKLFLMYQVQSWKEDNIGISYRFIKKYPRRYEIAIFLELFNITDVNPWSKRQ